MRRLDKSGQRDKAYRSDSAPVTEIAVMFSTAICFISDRELAAGHNLSLGRTAADHHRGVFACVEQVLSDPPGKRYR